MVLLVIDTQHGITDSRLYDFDNVKANIKKLIKTARASKVEVIYVQHDDGEGSGFSVGDKDFEVYSEFAPLKDEKRFYKKVNSAFYPETGLENYLQEKNVDTVIVTGLMTDLCIDATVKGAFERGFKVIIPAQCNSTRDNKYFSGETAYHFYNDYMWPDRYAKCVSLDEAVKLLQDTSCAE